MLKKIVLSLLVLATPFAASAAIVPSQDQLVYPAFRGVVVSTTTASTGRLSASTTLSSVFGGTGISTLPATDQFLIGIGNGAYGLKQLIAGSNVTISTTSNQVTISATGGSSGGSGITSFNGLTVATQTLATTSNAGGWGWVSSAAVHTLNIPIAGASTVLGLLSSTDWSTFNAKESVLSFTAPLSRAANTISCIVATASVSGCLSSTDWTTFNSKVATTSIDTSAKIAGIVTDETGSGLLTFNFSPTLSGTTSINSFTATTSTTTNATSTNLFSTRLILSGLGACNSSTQKPIVDAAGNWTCGTDTSGSGGSGGGWATTTDNNTQKNEVVTYTLNDAYIGGSSSSTATFNFDHDLPSLTMSSTTAGGWVLIGTTSTSSALGVTGDAFFTGNATMTNIVATGTAKIGTLAGIIKATSGLLSAATAGTDYENPLTFSYPLQRAVNTVSLAFGTTTANVWSSLQTFTSGFIANSSSTINGGLTVTTSTTTSATTTSFFATNASTTNLSVRSLRDSTSSLGSNGMLLQSNGTNVTWVATSTLGFTGGGGTPASPDTSVQYNNGGSFGGSLLNYDNTDPTTAKFNTASGTSGSAGNGLTIEVGDGQGGGAGGALALFAGDIDPASTGSGGAIYVVSGSANRASGDIGQGSAFTGNPGQFAGGNLSGGDGFVTGGSVVAATLGDYPSIAAGTAAIKAGGINGNSNTAHAVAYGDTYTGGGQTVGGDLLLEPGMGSGGGASGHVYFLDVDSVIKAKMDTTVLASSDKTFTFPNLSGTFCLVGQPCDGTGIATSTALSAGEVLYASSPSTTAGVATGTLTETVSGLQFDNTRALIGGSAVLSVSSGFQMLTTASGTAYDSFYNTPSSRITAGNQLSWATNTLNSSAVGTTSIDSCAKLSGIMTGVTGSCGSFALSVSPTFTGTALFAGASTTNASTTLLTARKLFDNNGSAGTSGQFLTSNGSTTAWASTSTLAYMMSLNGLTAPFQDFATTSSAGGFGFSSSGARHTLNIPTASANTALGLLSQSDFNTFTAKQNAISAGANISITGSTVINSLSLATSSLSTSALLAGLLTDETGSGLLTFNFSPTLTGTTSINSFTATTSTTTSATSTNLFSTRAIFTSATTTSFASTQICLTGDTCRTTWPTSGGGGSGGGWATTTDNNSQKNEVVTYTLNDAYIGGSASNTATFNFDHDLPSLTMSSTTAGGSISIGTTSSAVALNVTGSSFVTGSGTTSSFAATNTLSTATLCLTGDSCRTTWPTGGGSSVKYASYIVAASGGDFTTIQGALDQCGTAGGGNIYLTDTTYAQGGTGLTFKGPNCNIYGRDATTTITFTGATTLFKTNSAAGQYSNTGIHHVKITADGNTSGTAIDMSNMSHATYEDIVIDNVGRCFNIDDTQNITFYNKIDKITCTTVTAMGIDASSTNPQNSNMFYDILIGGGANTTCLEMNNGNTNVFTGLRCEPSTVSGTIGIHLFDNAMAGNDGVFGNVFNSPYIEANGQGIKIDASVAAGGGVQGNTFQGGIGDANTADLVIADNSKNNFIGWNNNFTFFTSLQGNVGINSGTSTSIFTVTDTGFSNPALLVQNNNNFAHNSLDFAKIALLNSTDSSNLLNLSNLGTGATILATSTRGTDFILRGLDGFMGLGTTTPSGVLSIQNSTTTRPLFSISTTTGAYSDLFSVWATTTGLTTWSNVQQSGVRVVIGNSIDAVGTKQQTKLDNFSYYGTSKQEGWDTADCDQMAVSVALSADGQYSSCPSLSFFEDNTATVAIGVALGDGNIYSPVGGVTTANDGGGLFVGNLAWLKVATNTPIVDTTISINGAATSTNYFIGFTNTNPAGTTFETYPTQGCFLVASSTQANWQLETKTNATTGTVVNTNIASTSVGNAATGVYYRFRVQADATSCTAFAQSTWNGQMQQVAKITTNIATTTALSMGVYTARNTANAGTQAATFRILDWWSSWRVYPMAQ